MIGPSTQIGPYEIVSRIGAGGMGEVWRARDTRIGRDVALKVLPPDVVSSPDRLRRFEQEARAAGSLSHPNLVTIHDVGTHDGAPYIVMELLEGDTLRDRIGGDGSGPRLPVRKAIEMSVQIASGLAAAHEKGIVHRDLKPENVFVTRDGRVKILDFGLAKLTLREDPSDDSRTQQRDTTPGAIVGTAGYMSPEQVRGQHVDHRTDVFAFGAILYESLTGRRAFRRDSSVETMNAILTEDPPEASSSAHHIPPAIDRIVRRCLEKAPEERFQSARDLAFALEAVSGTGTGSEVGTPAVSMVTARRIGARTLAGALAGLLLLAVTALAAYRFGSSRTSSAPMTTFRQLTFDAGIEGSPSISPDGETFAFVRDGDIFVQRVDGRNAINLTRTPEIYESTPAFSPDGRQIVFRSPSGLFLMGATGESARKISSGGFNPAWSPDGKRIAFSRAEETLDPRSRNTTISPLVVVDLATSKETEIYAGDAMQPAWSPDGSRIAFWANNDAGRRDIVSIGADGRRESFAPVTSDIALDWSPAWSADGKWLYFSSDRGGTMSVWRIAIDQRSGRTRGMPQLIPAPAPWAGRMSMSADGTRLVFETVTMANALYLGQFDPVKETLAIDEKPVLAGSLLVRAAAISPDGSAITFTTESPEDVFVMRSDGSDVRQLTNDEHRDRGTTWTPDGQNILFYSSRSGSYQLWTIRPDGSELTQLTALSHENLPNFGLFSPDQRRFVAVNSRGRWYMADASTRPVTRVDPLPLTPDGSALYPQSWSPDGSSITGRAWSGKRGAWIYDVARKSFRTVPGATDAVWLDDDRLLARGEDSLKLLNVRNGTTRDLLRTSLSLPNTVPGSRTHFVFRSVRFESDVWMAELKEE